MLGRGDEHGEMRSTSDPEEKLKAGACFIGKTEQDGGGGGWAYGQVRKKELCT